MSCHISHIRHIRTFTQHHTHPRRGCPALSRNLRNLGLVVLHQLIDGLWRAARTCGRREALASHATLQLLRKRRTARLRGCAAAGGHLRVLRLRVGALRRTRREAAGALRLATLCVVLVP